MVLYIFLVLSYKFCVLLSILFAKSVAKTKLSSSFVLSESSSVLLGTRPWTIQVDLHPIII